MERISVFLNYNAKTPICEVPTEKLARFFKTEKLLERFEKICVNTNYGDFQYFHKDRNSFTQGSEIYISEIANLPLGEYFEVEVKRFRLYNCFGETIKIVRVQPTTGGSYESETIKERRLKSLTLSEKIEYLSKSFCIM